jgi:hypothetical protein
MSLPDVMATDPSQTAAERVVMMSKELATTLVVPLPYESGGSKVVLRFCGYRQT